MLTLIKSSFIDYKLTILRNKKTPNSLFRQTMNEISYLIAAEVLKHLKYKKMSVQTPIKKSLGKQLSQSIVITDLEHMEEYADKLGMISTVIVGNSSTYNFNDLMINPRGYKSKYSLQAQQKMQN